jgi:hypothetical protein
MAKKMLSLKDESLTAAGSTTPPLASKYGATPQPSKMPAVAATPRDNGGLSDGMTGGNFAQTSLTKIPNNSGADASTTGAAEAQTSFEANAKS